MTSPSPAELIPHSGTMVLLHSVELHDESTTRCHCVPLRQSPLVDPGEQWVSSALTLEIMSQCAAAQAGLRQLESEDGGKPDRIGFLVSCRRLTLHNPTLDTHDGTEAEVTRVGEIDGGLTAFSGKVWQSGELIAEAEFSVFQPSSASDG